MKYGFTLPGRGPLATPDHLAAIARHGEELGYHFVLFGDNSGLAAGVVGMVTKYADWIEGCRKIGYIRGERGGCAPVASCRQA